MNRKLILKFDVKEGFIRCYMYKAESIRIEGQCKVKYKENSSKGAVHHKLNDLIMQLNTEFEIGFKSNNLKAIKAWIKANIFKIYIEKNMPDEFDEGILKLISDDCLIIRD